ncbi:MAG: hypothetical protein OPY05_05910 [Nitrosopumilus sp.]|nr:hypothetical protein [Nitrosopumilus sp.]
MTFFDLLNNRSTCMGRNGLIFFDNNRQDILTALISYSKKNWMSPIDGQRKTAGWKTEESTIGREQIIHIV